MRQYIDIRNEYELKEAIKELEKYARIYEFTAPYNLDDEGRTKVHIDVIGPMGADFNIEGRYDLIQLLITKIHTQPKA
jgi:hypothetical protein